MATFLVVERLYKTFRLSPVKVDDAADKGLNQDDLVHAYVFPGSGVTVSGSPFSAKLVAFFDLPGIAHEVHEADFNIAPKSKVPHIIHGGCLIGDSQLIIRYLDNAFDILASSKVARAEYGLSKTFVLFSSLSDIEKAHSELIRSSCENDLYWFISNLRWLGKFGPGKSEALWHATVRAYFAAIPAAIRGAITAMIRVDVARNAWGHGLSRHFPNNQICIVKSQIAALSAVLGKKNFFRGPFPSECDCAAFGTIDNLLDDCLWPNEVTLLIKQDYPNLVKYVERFKSTVFPDRKTGDLFQSLSLDIASIPMLLGEVGPIRGYGGGRYHQLSSVLIQHCSQQLNMRENMEMFY